MNNWLPHIILIGINLTNVFIDAYKIMKTPNVNVKHGVNLGIYLLFVGLMCLSNAEFELSGWQIVLLPFSAFFNRQIWFDIPLNRRRDLPWDYMSTAKPPKAIMDRIEQRIVGTNGRLITIIYAAFWILSLIIWAII